MERLQNSHGFILIFNIGNQTWICSGDGHFETDIPDRTKCVEEWIDDISQKVYIYIDIHTHTHKIFK